jgi:hypothetical protein
MASPEKVGDSMRGILGAAAGFVHREFDKPALLKFERRRAASHPWFRCRRGPVPTLKMPEVRLPKIDFSGALRLTTFPHVADHCIAREDIET